MAARRVHLPIDMSPRPGRTNVAGLVTHASLGQQFYPLYSKPWSSLPTSTQQFPKLAPSACAPNGFRPTWVVSINTYSPVAHRNGLTQQVWPEGSAASKRVAVVTQTPRPFAGGFVTRWPRVAPRWPSWAESPNAGR